MAKKESTISESQIMADVKAGNIAPVYLLTGEEGYYIDQLSDFFEGNIVPEENRDFDQTVVYGRDVHMADVVAYANQFPMMSEHRLVLVKEAQDIALREWELLTAYLEKATQQSVLVLCYRNKWKDKRTKLYAALKKGAVVYERNKLYDSEVPTWILTYVKQHGRSITEKAALLMYEALGNNLSKQSNELQKLFLSVKEGGTITDAEIERNVGVSKDYNIFELQNAIGRKDVVRCNKIVNYFADNPKSAPMPVVIANLYEYLMKVMIYHQLTDKSQYAAASALGVNPYFVKDYEGAARHYTLPKLAACIGYLHDADVRSKGVRNTGTVTDGELLKELVFKIIH
ncbi:MAG: DNA polymerase III subunit delta [Bacteroidales bacterium]|nr:DNA polymerase III subunit delta [Bacteroidales bacterium]